MSYEGYTLALCANRHRFTWNAHDYYREKRLCPICGEPYVWQAAVDETNGIDEETGHCPGYVELEIDQKEERIVRISGGRYEVLLKTATYKIPGGKHVS